MKKIWLAIITIIILIILGILFFPKSLEREDDITKCALNLYEQKKLEATQFDSQCLGTCDDYAVDIVHVPRSDVDNLVENQCEDYRQGIVSHFIELDKDGNVVRKV